LGWLHFVEMQDHAAPDGISESFSYIGSGASAMLDLCEVDADQSAEEELLSFTVRLLEHEPELEDRWPDRSARKGPLHVKAFAHSDQMTLAGVARVNRFLVRAKLTYRDEDKMRELMMQTLEALAKCIDIETELR